ncbi:MAG TPA: PDZ domain-containing protein [Vicinamibacteria bacterium]|nr:PDZ domain-containing protein [Vicinamibacteria bacterium]
MFRLACAGAIGLLLAGGLAPSEAGEGGKQRRTWSTQQGRLGVSLADVQGEDVGRLKLKAESGARVSAVTDDSPAAAAGIKEDDVIVRYQGEAVHSAAQLARLVRETPPGRKVQIDISRQGAEQQLTATLSEGKGFAMGFGQLGNLENLQELENLGNLYGALPTPPEPPEMPDLPPMMWNQEDARRIGDEARDAVRQVMRSRGPRLGIRYHELSDQLAGYFKVDDGVLVSSVDEESPAAKAGVKAGDVIVKLNGHSITDAADLGREVARLEPGAEATMTVQRDGHPLDLKVTVQGARSRRVPRGPTT